MSRETENDRAPESSHIEQWRDRLQDLIDGALEAAEAETVTAHAQACVECGKEQSRLIQMHEQLIAALSPPPALGGDFSARVFSAIDAAEELRRSAAKFKAEREFEIRVRAFRFDWRDFFQLHMGSIVAGIAVVAALTAGLGSLWSRLSGSLISAFPALALPGNSTIAVASLVIFVSLASTAFLVLRTSAR